MCGRLYPIYPMCGRGASGWLAAGAGIASGNGVETQEVADADRENTNRVVDGKCYGNDDQPSNAMIDGTMTSVRLLCDVQSNTNVQIKNANVGGILPQPTQ